MRQAGFTLLETILVVMLIGIFAAIAVPRFVNYVEAGTKAAAMASLEAGQAAVKLDFAKQIVEGEYQDPFTQTNEEGQNLHPQDKEKLEAMLQRGFNCPASFKWVLIKRGSTTSAPILGARLNGEVL